MIESAGYGSGIDVWAIGCIYVELLTGKPLFTGKNDYDMLKLILAMFQSSEELPQDLKNTFSQNNIFTSLKLPIPLNDDYNFDSTLDARMEGSSNSAVSFVRECLRLDPKKRPTA